MRVAANVYYYTYEDLQVNVPGNGGGIVVDNVGKVDGWGFESTLEWVATDNVDLYLAGAYGDSEVKKAEALCDGDSCVRRQAVAAGTEVLRLGDRQRCIFRRATATSFSAANSTDRAGRTAVCSS